MIIRSSPIVRRGFFFENWLAIKHYIYRPQGPKQLVLKRLKITLRLRIFLSMILIILVSFLTTGYVYFQSFKSENEEYHKERLKRKELAINESIDYFLRDQPISSNSDSIVNLFDDKICELADINNLDINIYSLSGNLIIGSNPELFDENIVPLSLSRSVRMAIEEASERLTVKHKRDTIEYWSTYDYIRNYQGEQIAIINLPYGDTNTIHQNDLKAFLIRLTEIYLALFIIAGIIAYLLSNYITGSLKAIGSRFKDTKINETTPALQWKFDDEIGTLVNEYNKMLLKLEESATSLAKTERESAWKEMAKQVAHEIKNPLTPMRLNVQYLEKTLKTEEPEKLKEFTQGMISQIDTLTNIAGAFSSFASMPELKIEEVAARDIIKQTTLLYTDYDISFNCEDENVLIKADKGQLIRVMNNLIKNAIQAIPENVEPAITVDMKSKGDEVEISVKDNGTGIPEEQWDKIFEPRFTTKTKGMGLGLAMVKNIIEGFGGKIWFETKLRVGTTFRIALPKA